MDKNIFLSIAIPTYNRAKFLSELLDTLIPQMKEDCEIFISDNASTDDTEEVVFEYMKRYPNINIRYHRHKKNIQPEPNIDFVVSNSQGRYVWMIGDDDQLVDGAIEYVYNTLKTDDYAMGVVNFIEYDWEVKRVYTPKVFDIEHDIRGCDLSTVLKHTGFFFSFLSSHIVNRELWVKADRSFKKNERLEATHIIVPIMIGARGKNFIISKPLVKKRTSVYDLVAIYEANIIKGWYISLKKAEELGVDRKTVKRFYKEWLCKGHLTRDILHKKLNKYPKFYRDIPMLISFFKTYYCFWIYVFPIFLMPRLALYLIYRVYKTIKPWVGGCK